jgi:hypothetical protein
MKAGKSKQAGREDDMKKVLILAAAMMMIGSSLASARVFVGVGPVYRPFRPAVRFGWGPYLGYGYGYGYGPYWGGGYVAAPRPTTGSIKFDTPEKSASVYVNDSYAGTVGEVKTLRLRPGNYDIRVAEPGRESYEEHVYVGLGSTTRVHPQLAPEQQPYSQQYSGQN